MKNLLLILLTSIAFTSVNAQSNLTVNLCENTDGVTVKEKMIEMTISQEKLLECTKLLSSDKSWRVSNFTFSIKIEGSVYEIKAEGNEINKRMIILIKKYNPEKIYLEKFKLVKGEETSTDALPLVLLMN
jgi:hypothetical protein